MPFSIDIRLPRERTPRFPDRCRRCLAPSPDATLRFAGRRSSALELLMPWLWLFRRPLRCEVPICFACRGQVIWHRRLQLLAKIAVAAAVVPVVAVWSKQNGWSRQWGKLAAVGAFFVVGVPVWLWFALRPLAFDLTVREHDVDYEFANRGYALEFHELNHEGGGGGWDSVDPGDADDADA